MQEQQLTECDKEPIHLLSAINSSKYLLTVADSSYEILQASQNCIEFFQKIDKSIEKYSLRELFDAAFILRFEAAKEQLQTSPKITAAFEFDGCYFIVQQQQGFCILEFEVVDKKLEESFEPIELIVQKLLQKCDIQSGFDDTLNHFVAVVHEISGYDRVMAYRFDRDYNGTIISQLSHEMEGDFLNHKFPSSDIPAQARQLYVKNRFRIIENVNDTPSVVSPQKNPVTQEILDMSFCYFRAVSAVHIEYLQNMGVGASMSLSIVVGGELWGLIVCHHPTQKKIPASKFNLFYLLSEFISKQIEQKEVVDDYEKQLQNKMKREVLYNQMQNHKDKEFEKIINSCITQIKNLTRCDECIVWFKDEYSSYNNSFTDAEVAELMQYVISCNEAIVCIDDLGVQNHKFLNFSHSLGAILGVNVLPNEGLYFLFVKYEQAQKVKWAGKKESVVSKDGKIILNPRRSFQTWKEEVRGTAKPFDKQEVASMRALSKSMYTFYEQHCINHEAKKLVKLNEKLQAKAVTDPVTLLYNQRYFYEQAVQKFQACQKDSLPCTFFMLKIVNFLHLQKECDKETIELILISIANAIRKNCENIDSIVARIGFDEFGVLLYDTSVKDTNALKDTIEDDMYECSIYTGNEKVSIEIETVVVNYQQGLFYTFSDMFKAAEILMRLKKE